MEVILGYIRLIERVYETLKLNNIWFRPLAAARGEHLRARGREYILVCATLYPTTNNEVWDLDDLVGKSPPGRLLHTSPEVVCQSSTHHIISQLKVSSLDIIRTLRLLAKGQIVHEVWNKDLGCYPPASWSWRWSWSWVGPQGTQRAGQSGYSDGRPRPGLQILPGLAVLPRPAKAGVAFDLESGKLAINAPFAFQLF